MVKVGKKVSLVIVTLEWVRNALVGVNGKSGEEGVVSNYCCVLLMR